MLTILIWLGSGFAFAVGMFVGMGIVTHFTNAHATNSEIIRKHGDTANELLAYRNNIGRREADALERIAAVLERVNPR